MISSGLSALKCYLFSFFFFPSALQYAKEGKKEVIIKWFERGCEEEEEPEEEEEFPMIEGVCVCV